MKTVEKFSTIPISQSSRRQFFLYTQLTYHKSRRFSDKPIIDFCRSPQSAKRTFVRRVFRPKKMTSTEQPTRASLSPADQRAFTRWQRLFSRPALFSIADPASPPSASTIDPSQQHDTQTNDCIRVVNRLYRTSPIIIFLNGQLQKLGCNPPIYCQHCDVRWRGGFSSTAGIMLCQNQMGDERRVESTLAHEMIHAFDHCRFKFDVNNLRHIACSEVCTTTGPSRTAAA